MIKDTEKKVDVTVTENGQEKQIKLTIKKPNNVLLSQAQRYGAKVWTECVRDGIMTKKELEKFMKNNGIWDDEKDVEQQKIINEIQSLEKELYIGGKNGKLRASEGKNIAVQMRVKRIELRNLIAEKLSMESNTAEALSDNARFDFLVANSTYHDNGQKVYNDLEDYRQNADSQTAFVAASALAQMMYSIDKDFEAKLPENKFLKMFNYVNDDLSLVDTSGHTVDADGRRIDENGYYINDNNQRVDKDGNLLDEFGNYIPTVEYVTDEKESKSKKGKSTDSN